MADFDIQSSEYLSTNLIKRFGLAYTNFIVFPINFVLKKNLALDVLTAKSVGILTVDDSLNNFDDAISLIVPEFLESALSDDLNTWSDDVLTQLYSVLTLSDTNQSNWSDAVSNNVVYIKYIDENLDAWNELTQFAVVEPYIDASDDLNNLLDNIEVFLVAERTVSTSDDLNAWSDVLAYVVDIDFTDDVNNWSDNFTVQNYLSLQLEDTNQAEWKSNLLLLES